MKDGRHFLSIFCLLTTLVGVALRADAAPVIFSGIDPGSGVGDPRPNSDAAASAFDAAAKVLGTVDVIDFEGFPVDPYTAPIEVSPGVTLTMNTNAPLGSGIVPTPFFGSQFLGYNTTPGGSLYVNLDTNAAQSTPFVSVEFSFDNPIVAWGAYISGIGNPQGAGNVNLVLEINNGRTAPLAVETAFPNGGILFFGLTTPGSPFSSVTLRLSDPSGFINANMGVDDVRFTFSVPPVIPIEIDIKPGNDPNSINLRSKGVIPVAILTTSTADGETLDFDAATVDPLSVEFGPDGAMETHGKGHIKDVDGDSDLDLVLHFKTQETGIQCGDTEAMLTGETVSGQAIEGSDSIKTVSCK